MNMHADIEDMKGGALVTPPTAETAMDVFKTPGGLDPYIAIVRKHVADFTPDVSSTKGRREIASMAAKVARSKTLLDDVGKALVADLKDLPKKIDATRKRWRDTLDGIKDEVRRPLTEWELAEDARVEKHEAALRRLEELSTGLVNGHVQAVEWYDAALAEVEAFQPGEDGEDFAEAYARVSARAMETLRTMRAQRVRNDAEAAELESLRREKAEREAKEKAEADARAQAEREERMKAEAAEKAKLDAEVGAERERQAAAKREADLKAEADAAERRAAEAEQRAKDEIARQQKADADAAAARERDRAHRSKINRAAKEALIAGGLTAECAEQAVKLIAQKMIPAVSIQY